MKRPADLSSAQRKQLRGLAHALKPIVQVGAKGLTEDTVAAVRDALEAHELIKVKVLGGAPMDRHDVGPELAERTESHEIGLIGRTLILYRRHAERPKVPLHT